MIIDLGRLAPDGETFAGEERPGILDLDGEELVQARDPVRYELAARVVSGELLVTGKIEVDLRFRCSRCGKPFARPVADPSFSFCREIAEPDESVDLTAEIREAILLAFPAYPVCRRDCCGLCPQCGTDLNEGRCDCRAPEDPRWGTLGGLNGLQ